MYYQYTVEKQKEVEVLRFQLYGEEPDYDSFEEELSIFKYACSFSKSCQRVEPWEPLRVPSYMHEVNDIIENTI
jgi:hypothetical protein